MDMTTTYLGLRLAHPLITGASPLVDHLDVVRQLEDAGAAAITMHSLFEEQIATDREAMWDQFDAHAHTNAEAGTYFPRQDEYAAASTNSRPTCGRSSVKWACSA